MKNFKPTFTFIIISYLFSSHHLTAQGWEWQNPLPTGNRINCIEFVDSLNGWFGSSNGTILHTTDGGNTWEIQYTGIHNVYVQSIDFLNRDEGWAVGNPDYGPSYIIHTSDGGKNWEIQLVDNSRIYNIITFMDRKHGWVGGGYGDIYYTRDGGNTWELGYATQGFAEITSIVFIDTLHGWAEGQNMPLLYSEDGGSSWSVDTTGIKGIKVFFYDSFHGWITTRRKLIRTLDSGKTWLNDLPEVTDALLTDVFFVDTLSGWVTAWEEGIFRTIDGGWTWEQIYDEYLWIDNGAYIFFNHLSGWIEFSRTWDGGKTLTYQKKGFTLHDISEVDFINENIGWVVGQSGLIAKTTDSGLSWNIQENGTGLGLQSVFALDENKVWALGSGVILKTEDGGETWQLKNYDVGSKSAGRTILFIDSMKGWIVGGDIKGWILHTEDGGDTWTEQTPGEITVLYDVIFVNENKGWAAASGYGGAIYNTTNGGETWLPQLENQPYHIKSIYFVDEHMGWAAGDDCIVHTTDGGENWNIQSEGRVIFPLDICFIDETHGWTCGILGKIYNTDDGGETWNRQFSGTVQALLSIDFIDENNGWVVGIGGSILYTTKGGMSDVVKKPNTECTSTDFYLYPNYPNPFNSQTVISYSLPERGSLILTIYNILGKEVIRLIDEVQPAGIHRITWNGRNGKGGDVPSGIYFYRIRIRDALQKSGKMILIR